MLVTRHRVFRRFWYPVMPMDRLGEGPRQFILLGEKIVLWLDADGKPAAAQDRCCHRTTELSRGFCENGKLVCGYHGWTFDRAGACVRVPQWDADRPIRFRIPAYRCEARYGYAWVALDEPLYPIPDIAEESDPAFRRIPEFYEPWRCGAYRFIENGFDFAHPSFTHRNSFGSAIDLTGTDLRYETFDGGFHQIGELQVQNPESQQKNLGMAKESTTRHSHNIYWMPFNQKVGIRYPNGLQHNIFNIMTPIDDTHSMLVQFAYRNDTEEQAPAAGVIAFDRQVTLEDKHILEFTDPEVLLTDFGHKEKSMESDRPGLIIRRMLHKLLLEHEEAGAASR
jgi:phenylpropionate dioxygenase-like ring-hydroxylating dioxygenase large terminal subunit